MRCAPFGLMLMLCIDTSAMAEIYRYTDKDGHTVFTNQPPEGIKAETVELPPANTLDASPPSSPSPTLPNAHSTAQAYSSIELSGIPDAQALRSNNGNFSVSARLTPALQPGHSLRLLLDGQPVGAAGSDTVFHLSGIERGEHSLQLEVLSGNRVIQSGPVNTFTLQRVNTSSPAMRPRPAP